MYNNCAQTKQIGDVIMKLQKRLLFLGALVATSLVACNHTQPSSQPEPDNHVNVFVLSGRRSTVLCPRHTFSPFLIMATSYFPVPVLQNWYLRKSMLRGG